MTIIEIENNLNNLISNFNKETFIFDLLLAYGTPKSTIKRLIGSDHDKLDTNGELIVRKKLFFKVASKNLHSVIDELKTQKEVTKHSPRFIIVTDFETLLAYDTKTSDSLDTELLNIVNHYDFFLPLAGMEKANFQDENPADVRASIKMAKLYDELQKNNKFESKEDRTFCDFFTLRWQHFQFYEKNILQDIKNSFDNLNKEIKELNKTIKNKKYFVSNKLSVLEIEKKDDYIQLIFSNGEICKIEKEYIVNIGFKDMENVYIDDGDIQDYSTRTKFTAEEIFNNIKNLKGYKRNE
ncbi:hypothetical protein AAX26_02032 [Aliarcobacter thereius]|uniref:type IIL restriction-modification enzyme MmeI n=1 Tax=Aliarcobacter TaxID=2321111 RepID=UPI000828B22B|nr:MULTISPECIES: type IIL restriction-modification enzyme MmeI [Aliarcobacter]MDD2508975.1 hypothetical protein [Aliarcobacter skirrowii]MDD3026413.1 hypothetical protein [Aliarcobacter skirrowii]MDD3497537.1 hypothetical protein [Aliarcobacter skirrowii]OCL85323.1 hypothetical protein AAX26_02032 [Aliarcobacter thereius]